MYWFVVPPSGGLDRKNSAENRLKAGLRTVSHPFRASAFNYHESILRVEWTHGKMIPRVEPQITRHV
jgi:hypothetical protein